MVNLFGTGGRQAFLCCMSNTRPLQKTISKGIVEISFASWELKLKSRDLLLYLY